MASSPDADELTIVTDASDPRLDDFRALTDARLRKLYEGERGVFIAEGPNVVRELLRSDYQTKTVLCTNERWNEHGDWIRHELADSTRDTPVALLAVERELLYELVRFKLHQGVIAVGHRPTPTSLDDCIAGASRVLVLEAMNDHENMGALFRSARAFGFDAVICGPESADPLYRRAVRVSMGHVLHVPFAQADDMQSLLHTLTASGFATVAADGRGEARPDVLAGLDRVALILGAEGPGLTDETIHAAAHRVRIPIDTAVDSLNVTVAASILMHAATGARNRA